MCLKRKEIVQNYDSPIFGVACYKSLNIVSVGGGGKRFGLLNKLISYRKVPPSDILDQKLFELNTSDDLIEYLTICPQLQLMAGVSDQEFLIFKVDEQTGQISQLNRVRSDYSKDGQINSIKFSKNGQYLATGGDDCVMRLYNVKSIDNGAKFKFDLMVEQKDHLAAINCVDIHYDNQIIASASDDNSCIIYNIDGSSLQQVKKLSFSISSEPCQYNFFQVQFTMDDQLVAINNAQKRDNRCYMSIWSLHDNIKYVSSKVISDHPVSAAAMSEEGLYYGVGTVDGKCKIINLRYIYQKYYYYYYCVLIMILIWNRYFDLEGDDQFHDMVVKGVSFTNDSRYMFSGACDYTYNFMSIMKQEGYWARGSRLWLIACLLLFVAMFIQQNLINRLFS